MIKYSDYLKNREREVGENHKSLFPIRTLEGTQNFHVKRLNRFTTKLSGAIDTVGSICLIEKYNTVRDVLQNKPFYELKN